MDKKHFFRTAGKAAAAMLLAAAMMTGFTGCMDILDNSDNPTSQQDGDGVEPTTDQMKVRVRYNMPTAVLAQFDENSVGAALVKRLSQTTSTIGDDTKLVLLDGSLVESLTDDDYYKMARVFMNGGYLALQRPTLENAFAFGLAIEEKCEVIMNNILKENGVEVSEEATASTRSLMDGQLVRKVNNARALTRADEGDDNSIFDELLIFTINSGYMIPPYNEEGTASSQTEDEQGQETEPVEHKVKYTLNPYHYGLLADGAASWLNTEEKEARDAKKNESAEARGLTRADGNQVINSMLSATDKFTVTGSLMAFDDQGRRYIRENASNTTIRSWSVYDFGSNSDYYYVEEDHHIRMGGQNSDRSKTLYWGPYRKEDWLYSVGGDPRFGIMHVNTFSIEGYEETGSEWGYYYGSWLDESDHTMDLKGAGTIKLEKSLPTTDNNQTTETIAIGSTDTSTHTSGWSFGGEVSKKGPSFNFSYSDTNTESHSTSFNMSISQVSRDLAVRKNTNGTEVKWNYEAGHTPTMLYPNFWHELAANILTNDCDLQNRVCWSVENPSGSYTLSWERTNWTRAQFVKYTQQYAQRFAVGRSFSKNYSLSAPRRFKKEWYCDLRVYGENLHNDALEVFREYLQKTINPSMFDVKFYVAESTDDGAEVIKYNVGVASEFLKETDPRRGTIEYNAKRKGIDKFEIIWYSVDPALKDKTFKITVEVTQ